MRAQTIFLNNIYGKVNIEGTTIQDHMGMNNNYVIGLGIAGLTFLALEDEASAYPLIEHSESSFDLILKDSTIKGNKFFRKAGLNHNDNMILGFTA